MKPPHFRDAVHVISEPLREPRGAMVVRLDEAHEVGPVERPKRMLDRGKGGLARIAATPELPGDRPPELAVRPTLGIVEPHAANQLAGGLLLHRPGPVASKPTWALIPR